MTYEPTSSSSTYNVTVTLAYEEWCALVAGVFLAEALAAKGLNDLTFYKCASDKLFAQVYGGASSY